MEHHLTAIISVLFSIIIGIVGFSFNRIIKRLDKMEHRYTQCMSQFADRGGNASAHRELYARTDALDRRVTVIETQIETAKQK